MFQSTEKYAEGRRTDMNEDFKEWCEKIDASYSHPSVRAEETAIGKEIEKYYKDEKIDKV